MALYSSLFCVRLRANTQKICGRVFGSSAVAEPCALCECTGAEEELQAFMRLCEGVTKRGWQCALARLALPVFHPPFFFFFFFLTSFFIFFISLLPQIFTRRLLSLLVPGRPNPNVLLLTRPLRGNAKPRQFPWR